MPPSPRLRIVVVIPCHDEPNLLVTLQSLHDTTRPPSVAVEVITVISASELDSAEVQQRNLETFQAATAWAATVNSPEFQFHILHFPHLPAKHAGVGLTRKIGMDEAIYRFRLAGNPNGILLSLDADCRCESNYLLAIAQYFAANPKLDSCSIAHRFLPAVGENASLIDQAAFRIALAQDILTMGLRHCGHPYAYMTVGAAMAVRAVAYQAQAGMNRRKAGEDFDFLQKFIELGVHGDCTTTTVHPAGRISRRKPAGLGQMIAQYCEAPDPDYLVFAWESFNALRIGLAHMRHWHAMNPTALETALENFPEGFREFMTAQAWIEKVQEMQKYTKTSEAFEKRFYRWFNSLKTFHYFQYCRDHHWANQPILEVQEAMREWMAAEA